MESTVEKETSAEQTAPEVAASPPAPAAPVMDVKPPQHSESPAGKPEDVVTPPPPEIDETEEKPAPQPQATQVAKPPKQKGSGVGLAIFGTVVIVLGLAVLAVYAYLQTNK